MYLKVHTTRAQMERLLVFSPFSSLDGSMYIATTGGGVMANQSVLGAMFSLCLSFSDYPENWLENIPKSCSFIYLYSSLCLTVFVDEDTRYGSNLT